MESIKVILTGATGYVGEGVLLECLQNEQVSEVLVIGRKTTGRTHPKLKEFLVRDFLTLTTALEVLSGYDACFYCAGISSVGMSEKDYSVITYDTTLQVGRVLLALNPRIVFNFVSGRHTDSSEKSPMMWARIKGKAENALMRLPFAGEYNFRPGFMKATAGQQHVKWIFKFFSLFYPRLFPSSSVTLQEVGRAMIHTTCQGYSKQVLEVRDIQAIGR